MDLEPEEDPDVDGGPAEDGQQPQDVGGRSQGTQVIRDLCHLIYCLLLIPID